MSAASGYARLVALAGELSAALVAAEAAGDRTRTEELRGELSLVEDLALPEAVSELRLQRIAHRAVVQAMAQPLPADLVGFAG